MTELNKTKNDFMNVILEAKKKDPLAFDWIKKKKGELKPITVQRKELEKFFDKETLIDFQIKGYKNLPYLDKKLFIQMLTLFLLEIQKLVNMKFTKLVKI